MTSTIEVQRSVLADPVTLERVVAHEMIHHRDYLADLERTGELARLRGPLARIFRAPTLGHGASFQAGMRVVNEVMGEGFVTVESDQAYATSKNARTFYLLIAPLGGAAVEGTYHGRLGYAWAARLSPEAARRVEEETAKGARLVRTADERWCGSARIKRFGGYSVPKAGSEAEGDLRALYSSGAE